MLAGNHLALGLATLIPQSASIGANIARLPRQAIARREVALTFDDGPNPDITPKVLDMLDAHGASASFFCVAEQALRYPELTREIERRGHSIENHSYRHPHTFGLYGWTRIQNELGAAQTALAGLTRNAPKFFRAPLGFRNLFVDPIMQRSGLRYVSWTRRAFDTVDSNPHRVTARLIRGLAAGDILLMHDGHAARSATGEPVVLLVLPRLLGCARSRATQVGIVAACVECGLNASHLPLV